MKKLYTFFLFPALLLTACVSEASAPSPSPVGSLPPAQDEHLEFYDQFDRYNNSLDDHDFVISEREADGKLHYCFENAEHGVTILVPPGEKTEAPTATLQYQNDTLEFEMPIFILGYGNVSGVAVFYLEDLTGDSTPELIYIYGAGGTGVWHDDVKVFDLSTMTECSVSWTPDTLADGLDVFVGNYNIISLQDGQLALTALYTEEDSIMVDYAGSLSAPLVFDPDAASFSLDTSCVTLTEFDDNT